jgi:hypothetical protein
LEQHISRPEQSLFWVQATQVLVRQCGVDPLHAAQVAPQWASTLHAAQVLTLQ